MKDKPIQIGKFAIGAGRPVFIIAEAGVNHNKSVAIAKQLVDVAQQAGADAVKFQNFTAEEVVTKHAGMAAYQVENIGKTTSQLEMSREFELTDEDFAEIAGYAKEKGIMFFSTPHSGFGSVDAMEKLGVPVFKFGSGDLNNLPVLEHAARLGKPIIIATGMAEMKDIEDAVAAIRNTGNEQIVVLQCTTDYPARVEDAHLRAMNTIRDTCNVIVGYSDHTVGSTTAVVAVALGACVLEKHITLDNAMHGPDHKASANPEDFKAYVHAVRDAEASLGSSEKIIAERARQYIPLVTKSVVARHAIKAGEMFTAENVAIKRPGEGLPPKVYFDVLGKQATRDLEPDEFVREGDFT